MKQIKVMVIDDSALVRQTLRDVLSSDPGINVTSTAVDPYFAVKKLRKEAPDVIVLDIEMPRMDGLTFLEKLMSQHPLPVVICSTLAGNGSHPALKAVELGAVEVIEKPKVGAKVFLEESKMLICDAVKAAAMVHPSRLKKLRTFSHAPSLSADAMLTIAKRVPLARTTDKVIAIGASTGGTEAIRVLISGLPLDSPGAVVVQHMPEHFTKSFSNMLDNECGVNVKEAEDGDAVIRSRVLIAPGNRHVLLRRSGARYYVEVSDGPLVRRHRPSVDVLFRSTAKAAGANSIGVILTGMGDDGAMGMKELKDAGAYTIAQDEATSVVFGMPNEAIKLGGVDVVRPIGVIAGEIIRRGGSLAA